MRTLGFLTMRCWVFGIALHLDFVAINGFRSRKISSPFHESSESDKEITFIRHGESLGNLMGKNVVQYASEAGLSMNAWKDGRLSITGKELAKKRVSKDFDDELVSRILSAKVVMVSPLVRTMETAIIMLAAALERAKVGTEVIDAMDFVVTSDLREKYSTESDKPGASPMDVSEFLRETAGLQGEWCLPMAEKLIEAYTLEKERTESFADDPTDAGKMLAAIGRFRKTLDESSWNDILIFGHNGWSRWMFAAGMHGKCIREGASEGNHTDLQVSEDSSPTFNVAFAGRPVRELKNVGVLMAKYSQDGRIHSVKLPSPDGKPLPTCTHKTKFALFSSIDEAKEAGVLAKDALVHQMLVEKKQDFGGLEPRWLTFSSAGDHSYMAWADKLGEPKKYIDFTEVGSSATEFKYACDVENLAVYIARDDKMIPVWSSYGRQERVLPFCMKTGDLSDFYLMCFLLRVHGQFARDTRFITAIFQEIGWDSGISDEQMKTYAEMDFKKWEAKWMDNHSKMPMVAEASPTVREELKRSTCFGV